MYENRRIADTMAARSISKQAFEEKVKGRETYLSTWFPYKIERTHVEYLPLHSIPRPFADQEGNKGAPSNYQFTGDSICGCMASVEEDGRREHHHCRRGRGLSLESTRPNTENRELRSKRETSLTVGVRIEAMRICSCYEEHRQVWRSAEQRASFVVCLATSRLGRMWSRQT